MAGENGIKRSLAEAGEDPPAKRQQTGRTRCRHWIRGRCERGPTCGFAHTGEAGQPHADDNAIPSKPKPAFSSRFNQFQAPGFGRGGPRPPRDPRFDYHPPGGPAWGPYAQPPFPQAPAQKDPERAVQAMQQRGLSKVDTPCRHWGKGKCSLGEKCLFSHTGEPGGNPAPPTVPCRHWTQQGSCSRGDACHFLHVPEQQGRGAYPVPHHNAGRTPCRHWVQRGQCQRGDTCNFAHETPPPAPHHYQDPGPPLGYDVYSQYYAPPPDPYAAQGWPAPPPQALAPHPQLGGYAPYGAKPPPPPPPPSHYDPLQHYGSGLLSYHSGYGV